jgi:hypothetical protein
MIASSRMPRLTLIAEKSSNLVSNSLRRRIEKDPSKPPSSLCCSLLLTSLTSPPLCSAPLPSSLSVRDERNPFLEDSPHRKPKEAMAMAMATIILERLSITES